MHKDKYIFAQLVALRILPTLIHPHLNNPINASFVSHWLRDSLMDL